ncbi:MAG: hypothetical protein LPJ94_03805 [Thauera sp.]|nr:hypothetical protein [Thauera sp.]
MFRMAMCLGLAGLACAGYAQDPVVTDGDKYRVLLENEQVRVLEYRDRPGERTEQHQHPAFVLYALAPFKRRIALPDGKVIMREFKQGDVLYSDQQTHVGENVGDTPTHVIMVELKTPPAPAAQAR